MKRQDFRSQVIQKSEGAHRDKALLIFCTSAIMENQNLCVGMRGQRYRSLLLGETTCHVKEQGCRKVARPCLGSRTNEKLPEGVHLGPSRQNITIAFKIRNFSEITHHETKGKKQKIRYKKLLQTTRTDVQERSQEKKVYRNMGTDHHVRDMTRQLESR